METIGAGCGEQIIEPVRTNSQNPGDAKNLIEGAIWSSSSPGKGGKAGEAGETCEAGKASSQPVGCIPRVSSDLTQCFDQCSLEYNGIDSTDDDAEDEPLNEHFVDGEGHGSVAPSPEDSYSLSSTQSSNASLPRHHYVCCGTSLDAPLLRDERELTSSEEVFVELPLVDRAKTTPPPPPPPPPPPSDRDIKREISRLSFSNICSFAVEPEQIASSTSSHSLPPKPQSPPPPKNTPEKTPSRQGVDREDALAMGLDLTGLQLREQYIRQYYGHEADTTAILDDSGSDILYGSDIIDDSDNKNSSEPEDKKSEGRLERLWSKLRSVRTGSKTPELTDVADFPPNAPPVLTSRKSSSLLARMFTRTSSTNTSSRTRNLLHRVADQDKTRSHSLPKALWGAASAAAVAASTVVAAGDSQTDPDKNLPHRPVDQTVSLSKSPSEESGSRPLTESSSQTDECGPWVQASPIRSSYSNSNVLRRLGSRWLLLGRRRPNENRSTAVD